MLIFHSECWNFSKTGSAVCSVKLFCSILRGKKKNRREKHTFPILRSIQPLFNAVLFREKKIKNPSVRCYDMYCLRRELILCKLWLQLPVVECVVYVCVCVYVCI